LNLPWCFFEVGINALGDFLQSSFLYQLLQVVINSIVPLRQIGPAVYLTWFYMQIMYVPYKLMSLLGFAPFFKS
jgi:hypothetical protein